jgi:hypothetical protein
MSLSLPIICPSDRSNSNAAKQLPSSGSLLERRQASRLTFAPSVHCSSQILLPKNAIQKHSAIAAVRMKFRGETSHDVSEIIRPNAKQVNRTAKKNNQLMGCRSRFVRFRACASMFGERSGTGDAANRSTASSWRAAANSWSLAKNSSMSAPLSALASPAA